LDKSLLGYATAAVAAGVGVLALTHPAEAKIHYTPSNIPIPFNTTVQLDLNHDGIPDFTVTNFSNTSAIRGGIHRGVRPRGHALRRPPTGDGVRPPASFGQFGLTVAPAQPGNGIGAITSFIGGQWAAELQPDRFISSFRVFADSKVGMDFWAFSRTISGTVQGPWQDNKGGFLALKFVVSGKTYFGWAHISTPAGFPFETPAITGYAFEDEPNTGLLTGDRGPVENSAPSNPAALPASEPQPATLGALALGARGLALWRRPEGMN
jgi:hypothetical protein